MFVIQKYHTQVFMIKQGEKVISVIVNGLFLVLNDLILSEISYCTRIYKTNQYRTKTLFKIRDFGLSLVSTRSQTLGVKFDWDDAVSIFEHHAARFEYEKTNLSYATFVFL